MALSPAGSDWTDAENDVLVANYFAMLADEMAGRAFVKRRHNAAVVAEIGRTRGSVEFKYQSVSAVLSRLGSPWINGAYLPRARTRPLYVDVIIRRYEAATGKAATLNQTGEDFSVLAARRAAEAASPVI